MNTIKETIRTIPQTRIVLVGNSGKYSYGSLQKLYEKNIETLTILKGTSVVINGRDRMEFSLLLFLLDGTAKNILFLPPDIESALHGQYYDDIGVEFEVFLENDILKYVKVASSINNQEKKEFITRWIIPTSGTTSKPKLISHTFDSLTRATKKNIDVGEHFKWGLVFDIYRFSGIQVFLQSILAGSTLIITESSQSMSEILNTLSDGGCNALSATSSFWRKVLMSQESDKLELERITLGGEIADENILQALKKRFPDAKISHIYASTEVGVGFSVTDGHAGFPKKYLDKGINGLQMKVSDDGLLYIAPKMKNQSYVSQENMYDNEGYINTGDLVEIKGDRVYFLGRDSGAINVGGNKVQPEEVEKIIVDSGIVSAAYVYAIKNPMMGSLVCADVVLNDLDMNSKEAKKDILSYCRKHLEGFKVPAIIKFVRELKTTQSGKLKRKNK
jgi:acyl-CoA synthetase (AMP-forming)/AMP-acid ligase II